MGGVRNCGRKSLVANRSRGEAGEGAGAGIDRDGAPLTAEPAARDDRRRTMFLVEPVEATWSEWCSLYRAFLKHVSISEVDGEEQSVCYACASPPVIGFQNPDIDFEPLNFQVQYYFQSRKGMCAECWLPRVVSSLSFATPHTGLLCSFVTPWSHATYLVNVRSSLNVL